MKKILVAEDDGMVAAAYSVKLKKGGFRVRVVSDGKEALKEVEHFEPDLILLDLIMPVMDGFTTLVALKKNPRTCDIPVVIASNVGQTSDISKGMALGATDFVVKSDISLSELINKLNQYL